MPTVNKSKDYKFKITQKIGVTERTLQNLSKYFKITDSKKDINTYFSDINNFFPKMAEVFGEYETQKNRIKELEHENQELQDLTSEDFEAKEKLANEIRQLRANIENREQQYLEKEQFIDEHYEKTIEQKEIFEKYSRIYLFLAIPIRFSILEYFYTTQNNLATTMVFEHLSKDPNVQRIYPNLTRLTIGNQLRKLTALGYLERILKGFFRITTKGSDYYKQSVLHNDEGN